MKCYKCGSFLYESDYCANCGADVSTYKKIVKRSNEMYNRGLEMAKAHNMTGAIECLKVSLKMYKANTNARNLLGLIYVEIGEYALGLAQWVISQNLQSENNIADQFMDKLQNSRQYLHTIKLTTRKYNKAIEYIQQENYDLAEIQLKKLVNENTHMVKGYQLLALLLMRKKKYAEARNVLFKARMIDQGNPTTIAYTNAVEEEIKEAEAELSPTELRNKRLQEKQDAKEHSPLSGDDVIIPKSSYREYNPATMTVLQILIGVIIGAAIIFFIVTPAKTKTVRNEYQAQIADLNARIEQLQQEIPETTAEGETEAAVTNREDSSFSNLVSAQIAYNDEDLDAALEALENVNEDVLSDEQKTYYNEMKDTILNQKYESQIYEAVDSYNSENYENAKNLLQEAYDNNVRTAEVLYYLGRSYDYLDDQEKALPYLQELVEKYPDFWDIEIAQQIINGITS